MPMVNEIHIKQVKVKHLKDRKATFGFDGKVFKPDKDGFITIPDCLLPEAKEHNFHLIRSKEEDAAVEETETAMTIAEKEAAGVLTDKEKKELADKQAAEEKAAADAKAEEKKQHTLTLGEKKA